MVNPEEETFFCPQIKGDCVGRKCIAMEKKIHTWSNESCMGAETFHSREYYECQHYERVKIWL